MSAARPGAMRFGINHYVVPDGYPLEAFLDVVAATGAGAVGLTRQALAEHPAPRLRQMLRERDLAVTSLNSAGFFLHGEPVLSRRQQAVNAALIEAAAELEAQVLVVIAGGLGGGTGHPLRLDDARHRVEEELALLVERGVSCGVRIGLEPMHPFRIFSRSVISTIGEAAALSARLPGLGLVLDLFHVWWDPEIAQSIARAIERIALVQLCGIAAGRGEGAPPRRCAIGRSEIDISGLVGILAWAGYAGPCEFELFAADLGGEPVEAAIWAAAAESTALLESAQLKARSRA